MKKYLADHDLTPGAKMFLEHLARDIQEVRKNGFKYIPHFCYYPDYRYPMGWQEGQPLKPLNEIIKEHQSPLTNLVLCETLVS